jgi:hypothetical protein
MLYLASPYSHPDPLEMEYRYEQACKVTAHFLRLSFVVYSPIVHCHQLAKEFSLPTDFLFWQKFCLAMLNKADGLWVLQLDGWQTSKGVNAEIIHAVNSDIPVVYVDMDEIPHGKNNQHGGI